MGISPIFTDAKFQWNGTTWTIGDTEWWDYPLAMGQESSADHRRSWDGTGRKHVQWSGKQVLGFSWTSVGTAVRDYVRNWHGYAGTILVEANIGTWTTHADDDSYSCENPLYGVYDVGITLREV